MPWIRKIHLILSDPTQIPDWLDSGKIDIIYHDEFIPSGVLPVFNSSAIECFLKNIPKERIAEHFLYGNDDMFVIHPAAPSDFFEEDGTPVIPYDIISEVTSYFAQRVKRSSDLIKFKKKYIGCGQFIMPSHAQALPLTGEALRALKFYATQIDASVTRFRDSGRNVNQYIYSDWLILNKKARRGNRSTGHYIDLFDSIDKITRDINSLPSECKMICVNDVVAATDAKWVDVKELLDTLWPNKSMYERRKFVIDYLKMRTSLPEEKKNQSSSWPPSSPFIELFAQSMKNSWILAR